MYITLNVRNILIVRQIYRVLDFKISHPMLKLRNSLIINMIPSQWENTVVMQKIEIMAFLEALFLHLGYLIE